MDLARPVDGGKWERWRRRCRSSKEEWKMEVEYGEVEDNAVSAAGRYEAVISCGE